MRLSKRIVWALLLFSAGCGRSDIYPVKGRVVDMQGQPIAGLKGGSVEFESTNPPSSANGVIEADGSFRLTTKVLGDGARLGKHRVMIMRPFFGSDSPRPFAIDPKYENSTTSGLEVTVQPRDNVVELKVERIQQGRSD